MRSATPRGETVWMRANAVNDLLQAANDLPAGADVVKVRAAVEAVSAWHDSTGKGTVAKKHAARNTIDALMRHLNEANLGGPLLAACRALAPHVAAPRGVLSVRRRT